jgi:recombination protein RecT
MTNDTQKTELVAFHSSLAKMAPQFKAALPSHISPEKFVRVVQTVTTLNPDLLLADRRSLFAACTKCAQDGLIPDGREAALVVFNTNTGTKTQPKWTKAVQYMPMVAGIMKKVRNSDTIAKWSVHVVKENDKFDYELGDNEQLTHKPALTKRGNVIAAYSIVTTKDGMISREVMATEEIEAVRARSRSKDSGPWVTDYDEMCKKTVIRRHSKRLDMDTEKAGELASVIRADDDLTDLTSPLEVVATQEVPAKPTRPRRLPGAAASPPPEPEQPPEEPPFDDDPPAADEMP